MRRTLVGLAAAALLILPVGFAGSAAAAPGPVHATSSVKVVKYKNCTQLNKKYAGGVATSTRVHNTKTSHGKKVRATSHHSPKVSAALYAANKKLDRDKDGIACER